MVAQARARMRARYSQAMFLLSVCGKTATRKAIKTATRPNSSLNIARLLGIATVLYTRHNNNPRKRA
jgi:hypothetical protein